MNFGLKSLISDTYRLINRLFILNNKAMKTKFNRSGNLIASVDIDRNVCYAAARHGSADVYGRYELGRSYVAPVSEGKPVFSGFSAEEMEKIKIVSRGDFDLEDGKYYTFRLIKIELGFCRKLIKIKFRVLEEIDFASLK